jgi:hypothetical protein
VTNEVEIYWAIRSEIITNQVLMHITTLVVVAILLRGVWLVERRRSVLSVFLPLLTLSWAAAVVRFDYFIHRQGAYLRAVEARLKESGVSTPLWETWKTSLRSTAFVVPAADLIVLLVVVAPTVYLLFGPAQEFFAEKRRRRGRAYAWGVIIVLGLLLASLPLIPKIAEM